MGDTIRWCFKHQQRASWDYARNDDAEICLFGDEVEEVTGVKQGQRWYDCDVSDMKPARIRCNSENGIDGHCACEVPCYGKDGE